MGPIRGRGGVATWPPEGATSTASSRSSSSNSSHSVEVGNPLRIPGQPASPQVVGDLRQQPVGVVNQTHGKCSQSRRKSRYKQVPEEERLLLSRGNQGNHGGPEVNRQLCFLKAWQSVQKPDVLQSLLQAAFTAGDGGRD